MTSQPPMVDAPDSAIPTEYDPFNEDRFLLRQKLLTINQKYTVADADGTPIFFVERPAHVGRSILALIGAIAAFLIVSGSGVAAATALPRTQGALSAASGITGLVLGIVAALAVAILLTPKRHISFYPDETKSRRLLEITQDFKFAVINARYTVLDEQGRPLAVMVKNYIRHVFRRHWRVEGPDGALLCEALEDSWVKAVLRRLCGPMYGMLRTNFIIVRRDGGRTLGTFNRRMTIFDRYVLDMTQDPEVTLDRRIALALGVMLDTGESR